MIRWTDIEAKVDAIPNWMLPGQARWLFETAQAIPTNGIILEIGGYLGHSTAALAFACVDTQRHAYCIDTFCGNDADFLPGRDFEGENFLSRWHENIQRLDLTKYVTALVSPSSEHWETWQMPIDFLFIDGSHQYHEALGDFCHFSRHVVPCGIVALHDVHPLYGQPGPYRAWCEMGATLLENTWVACETIGYGLKPC